MITHLLDTDTCILLIRRKSEAVLSRLRMRPVGSVGISTITLGELHFGVARSSRPEQNLMALTQFCAPLQILEFDDRAAVAYGGVRERLERAGLSAGPLDTLIAAHAFSMPATLVTNNEREFRRVKGLEVENWARR